MWRMAPHFLATYATAAAWQRGGSCGPSRYFQASCRTGKPARPPPTFKWFSWPGEWEEEATVAFADVSETDATRHTFKVFLN